MVFALRPLSQPKWVKPWGDLMLRGGPYSCFGLHPNFLSSRQWMQLGDHGEEKIPICSFQDLAFRLFEPVSLPDNVCMLFDTWLRQRGRDRKEKVTWKDDLWVMKHGLCTDEEQDRERRRDRPYVQITWGFDSTLQWIITLFGFSTEWNDFHTASRYFFLQGLNPVDICAWERQSTGPGESHPAVKAIVPFRVSICSSLLTRSDRHQSIWFVFSVLWAKVKTISACVCINACKHT